MSWLTRFFTSSLGKKLIMALSGLFLCSFLIVHLIGNTQLFYQDEGLAFNKYAVFMTSNPLIEIVSYGLYAFILLHAFDGLYLAYKNRRARPVGYKKMDNSSRWEARNMGILGTILLIFIAVHLSNFWWDYRFGYVPYKKYTEDISTGQLVSSQDLPADYAVKRRIVEDLDEAKGQKITIVRDLYKKVEYGFANPLIVLLYVVAMGALAYHLLHGFQSAFQTLGLNHPKYNPLIRWVGAGIFAILIPLGFAALPIYFFVKSLG